MATQAIPLPTRVAAFGSGAADLGKTRRYPADLRHTPRWRVLERPWWIFLKSAVFLLILQSIYFLMDLFQSKSQLKICLDDASIKEYLPLCGELQRSNTPLIYQDGGYKSLWREGKLPQLASLHCRGNIYSEEREQRTRTEADNSSPQ